MRIGDIFYIRNRSGKLTVELIERLSLEDVTTGIGPDRLPAMNNPRLEFHKSRSGNRIITLCERNSALPGTMYVSILNDFERPEIWKGRYEDTEEDELIYETEF